MSGRNNALPNYGPINGVVGVGSSNLPAPTNNGAGFSRF